MRKGKKEVQIPTIEEWETQEKVVEISGIKKFRI
jgi:hypothetical protein